MVVWDVKKWLSGSSFSVYRRYVGVDRNPIVGGDDGFIAVLVMGSQSLVN